MKEEFYTEQISNQANNLDFKAEQSEFKTKSETIQEVQDEYKLYIDHYLEKDQSKWVDAPLFDLIDANQDQKKVITYIDYELENKHSKDDLKQLKDLKTVLEKQDYKEKIHIFPNNINFWILWWEYKEKSWEEHKLTMHNIKKIRKNRYKLLLQRDWSNRIEKYQINYDWSDYVSIYNQFWIRLWREQIEKGNTIFIEWNKYRKEQSQTEWELTIKTSKGNYNLDLIFVA